MTNMLSNNVKILISIAISIPLLVTDILYNYKSIVPRVSAQTGCTSPPGATRATTWRQGAQVRVNIDPDYNPNQRNAIAAAFTNWNAARFSNCSAVVFLTPTYDITPIADPGIPPSGNSVDYKYQVYKIDPPDEPQTRGISGVHNTATYIIEAWSYLNTAVTEPEALKQLMAHEIGHQFGLLECNRCGSTQSIVNGPVSSFNDTNGLTAPTSCDNMKIKEVGMYVCPTPTPTPTPEEIDESQGCYPHFAWLDCPPDIGFWTGYPDCACIYSPILVDITGNGFNLTNAQNGVRFDINGDGATEQIAWTVPDSDDAWLTLDRNGNGLIDNGKELFGSVTEQTTPAGTIHHGFLALAEYNKPSNGGNGDGVINNQDAVFTNLRLWQDTNHNGISEASELHSLSSLNIETIELKYKESKRMDEFGNRFRYRAKVKDAHGAQVGRWAWDVFLVRE